jgi:hypothetical protein
MLEREARGWSPAVLARWMTAAGAPMNQSAIYRIENGTPRRRITVDEAVAFAWVFGTTVGDLVMPVARSTFQKRRDEAREETLRFVEELDAERVEQAAPEHREEVKRRLDALRRYLIASERTPLQPEDDSYVAEDLRRRRDRYRESIEETLGRERNGD